MKFKIGDHIICNEPNEWYEQNTRSKIVGIIYGVTDGETDQYEMLDTGGRW
jgi:hypothetical protein